MGTSPAGDKQPSSGPGFFPAVGSVIASAFILSAFASVAVGREEHKQAATAICDAMRQRYYDAASEGKVLEVDPVITSRQTGVAGGLPVRCHITAAI